MLPIKVGDKVKVLRKAQSYERNWRNLWTPDMDEAIGKEFIVDRIADNGVALVGSRYRYPEFVLERVYDDDTVLKAITTVTYQVGDKTFTDKAEALKCLTHNRLYDLLNSEGHVSFSGTHVGKIIKEFDKIKDILNAG